MEPILAPAIYQEFIDALEIQAQEIQADRITMRFEPRFVEYEETTDKVFVYGHSFVKGAAFDAKRNVQIEHTSLSSVCRTICQSLII